jgi:hypothetical protein
VVTAYSPLAKARKMSDPDLLAIASKYKRTPAQVRLTMRLQRHMRVGRLFVGGGVGVTRAYTCVHMSVTYAYISACRVYTGCTHERYI